MCTAITFCSRDHYFGRNLDLERVYDVSVTITPRNYPFLFRNGSKILSHYAIIGVAHVSENYPLYFDATNESGLSMAGLNFPENAHYFPLFKSKENITPFELIPRILSTCKNLQEAKTALKQINLWDKAFSEDLPLSPLHWLLAYRNESVAIECTATGIQIYDNPVGVLTNNPPFPYHLHNFTNYMSLTEKPPVNNQSIALHPYSLGLGSFGLPGDMSSGSRFVKAAFTKLHSICNSDERSSVNQFFHILDSVCQQRGMTQLENGEFEFTLYSSCCNTDKGIFYYKTYDNSSIVSVNMHLEKLDSDKLICYPFIKDTPYFIQNIKPNNQISHLEDKK